MISTALTDCHPAGNSWPKTRCASARPRRASGSSRPARTPQKTHDPANSTAIDDQPVALAARPVLRREAARRRTRRRRRTRITRCRCSTSSSHSGSACAEQATSRLRAASEPRCRSPACASRARRVLGRRGSARGEAGVAQVAARRDVLHEPEEHADRRGAEPPVPGVRGSMSPALEPSLERRALREPAAHERREEGAEVDPHVEDREAGVAARRPSSA